MSNRKMILNYLAGIITISLIFVSAASATNWYVRPSGGSGSGTSWTAAWNGMGGINWSSVQCGDTVWIAGGSYSTDLIPTRSGCTSGSQLYIRRARSDAPECTGAAGWSSGYDSNIQQSSGIPLTTGVSYVTFSGRTAAAGGTQGWIMTDTDAGSRVINVSSGSFNHLTFEYININGGVGVPTVSGGNDSRAVNIATSSNPMSYLTFSHVNIQGFCSGIYLNGVDYFTFEYSSVYNQNPSDEGPSGCHSDPIFPIKGNHGIVRYSKFHDNTGEGIYFPSFGGGGWTDWKIYGNLFYNINIGYAKAIEVESTITNLKIFNNTFYNNWADLMLYNSPCGTGTEVRNNLVYNSQGLQTCGTMSNNLDISSPNPFVSLGSSDFHIISTTGASYPRNIGTNLSSYFAVDMDGNAFGADGTWDIGAYEYGTASSSLKPPSNLRIVN